MQAANAGWSGLLRFCATGLFIVSAIVYWGAWTPTTAAGLLAAGLACLAGSFLNMPETTTQGHMTHARRDTAYDEPLARDRTRERSRV